MKSCVVGGLQLLVLSFEFHQNRLSGFGAVGVGVVICPSPIDLAIGLYNSLYYRTSRDKNIQAHNRNGISIGSAVFAQMTVMCPYTLQLDALSKKLPLPCGSWTAI